MEDHGKNREEGPQAPKSPKRDIAFVELYEWIESAVLAVVFVILHSARGPLWSAEAR